MAGWVSDEPYHTPSPWHHKHQSLRIEGTIIKSHQHQPSLIPAPCPHGLMEWRLPGYQVPELPTHQHHSCLPAAQDPPSPHRVDVHKVALTPFSRALGKHLGV